MKYTLCFLLTGLFSVPISACSPLAETSTHTRDSSSASTYRRPYSMIPCDLLFGMFGGLLGALVLFGIRRYSQKSSQ